MMAQSANIFIILYLHVVGKNNYSYLATFSLVIKGSNIRDFVPNQA